MNLTIGKRIALGYIALLILLIIVGIIGYQTIAHLTEHTDLARNSTDSEIFFLEREIDHLKWLRSLNNYLLINTEFTGQLDHTQCNLGKWLYGEKVQALQDPQVKKVLKDLEMSHREMHQSAANIIKQKSQGNEKAALKIFQETTLLSLQQIGDDLDLLKKHYYSQTEKEQKEMDKVAKSALTIIPVVLIIAIILGFVLAVVVSRRIINTLNHLIKNLNENAQLVAAASEQLSSSSRQLAEGSSEQAASIEETSVTLEQTASMTRLNFENTKQAVQLALKTREAADNGNQEMQEMQQSMNELKKSSDQVAKIIKVIDDIAFQTNILALNAAVEAARAGEAGMGFAVVADEVRNLAQRSAKAAQDTAEIIEKNIRISTNGVAVTEKVRMALEDITTQAKRVNELLNDITAASQEQTQGVQQINKAVLQMEQVVQQNATSAEECASAAEELSNQAINLREAVAILMNLVQGGQSELE
jgi:methyl-accepting chemotaxis protein